MPLYRFLCRNCGREVELFLSLGELNRGAAACPSCKGGNLEGPLAEETAAVRGAACSLSKKS